MIYTINYKKSANFAFITADKISADDGKVVPVSWAFIFRWIIFVKEIVIS